MFVNESQTLEIHRDNGAQICMSEEGIVTIQGNVIKAHRPGSVTLTLGDATCKVLVHKQVALICEPRSSESVVGNFMIFTAEIVVDGVVSFPGRNLRWEIIRGGSNGKIIKQNKNWIGVIEGIRSGSVTIRASAFGLVGEGTVAFVDKLSLPDHLVIASGGYGTISCHPFELYGSVVKKRKCVRVEERPGEHRLIVHGVSVGQAILHVHAGIQWGSVAVSVVEPLDVVVRNAGSRVIQAQVLDEAGAIVGGHVPTEIDEQDKVGVVSAFAGDGRISFNPQNVGLMDISMHIGGLPAVARINKWPLSPRAPVVPLGALVRFTCTVASADWRSLNECVAEDRGGGLFKAVGLGHAVIQCTNKVDTRMQVVRFTKLYLIEPPVGNGSLSYGINLTVEPVDVNPSRLQRVNYRIQCKWSDEQCGSVFPRHGETGDWCDLVFKTRDDDGTCDRESQLNVTIHTPDGRTLQATKEVKLAELVNKGYGLPPRPMLIFTKHRRNGTLPMRVWSPGRFVARHPPKGITLDSVPVGPQGGRIDVSITREFNTTENAELVITDEETQGTISVLLRYDRFFEHFDSGLVGNNKNPFYLCIGICIGICIGTCITMIVHGMGIRAQRQLEAKNTKIAEPEGQTLQLEAPVVVTEEEEEEEEPLDEEVLHEKVERG
jgi:hypothetical protein